MIVSAQGAAFSRFSRRAGDSGDARARVRDVLDRLSAWQRKMNSAKPVKSVRSAI